MADERVKESTETEPLAKVVREVLAPLVAVDAGRIEWVGRRGTVAEVRFAGACAGCPGQPITVTHVVLPALQAADPDITEVRVKLGVD